jgi:hypothetical protein
MAAYTLSVYKVRAKLLPKVLFFSTLAPLLVVSATASIVGGMIQAVHVLFGATRNVSFLRELDYLIVGSHVFIEVAVSLIALPPTLFVILSNQYKPKDKHWAYVTLGMVIGFWL